MRRVFLVAFVTAIVCVFIQAPAKRVTAFDSPIQWVAFGDSITVGYGASPGHSFINLISASVGPVDNLGVGGSMAANQVQRISDYSGPATNVIWMAGFLDARWYTPLAEYESTLRAGLATLQQRGDRVYLGTCLRMSDPGYDPSVAGVIAVQRQVAAEFPNVVIAETSALYDPANVISDTVHPNDAGHDQIATAFSVAIKPHRLYVPLVATDIIQRNAIGRYTREGGTYLIDESKVSHGFHMQ